MLSSTGGKMGISILMKQLTESAERER